MSVAAELPKEMQSLQFRPLFIFRIAVNKPSVIGQTPSDRPPRRRDHRRHFRGRAAARKILSGGSDWQTVRRDGSWVLDVRFVMETDDGHLIGMTYKGIRHGPQAVLDRIAKGESVSPADYYFRVAPFFETASEKYGWLNNVVVGGDRPSPRQRTDLSGLRGACRFYASAACLRGAVTPSVSFTISPSAAKSSFRGEVRRHARPTVRAGSGGEAQQLHAPVAHLDIDRDLRHQRHAIAVGHHLHHGGERGGAEAGRALAPGVAQKASAWSRRQWPSSSRISRR